MKILNAVLVHYDFDGAAASIIVHKFLDAEGYIHQYPCGYSSLQKNMDKMLREADARPMRVFILDLDLDEKQLDRIIHHKNIKSVLYCDHHPKTDDWFDYTKRQAETNFRFFVNENKCGAEITYDVMSKIFNEEKPEMKKLAEMAGVYDLWKLDHFEFENMADMNLLFWNIHYWSFFKYLKNGMRLGKGAREIIAKERAEREIYIKDTLENWTIYGDTGNEDDIGDYRIAAIVNPKCKYTNDLKRLIPEIDAMVIYRGSYDKKGGLEFSFRANKELGKNPGINPNWGIDLNEFCRKLSDSSDNFDGGGHKLAAGITVRGMDLQEATEFLFEKLIDEISIGCQIPF